jgi:glycosyltransferase involved in cell wall biosynthesis
MPRVSVLIPTRDRPQFLAEAIASVRAQRLDDHEIIVINDGHDHLQLNDVRILDNQQRGAVTARNLGVQMSQGEVIAFLDDDDVWVDTGHLCQAVLALQSGADFYFADGIMRFPNEDKPRIFARDANASSLEKDNTVLVSAACYRRSLHQALGAFDETLPYYWDWDWYMRVARAGYVLHHQPSVAVDIRIHADNMSGATQAAKRQENLDRFATKHQLGTLALKNHTDFTECD